MTKYKSSKYPILTLALLFLLIVSISFILAAEQTSVSAQTVCCEKTNSGLYCQNVLSSECSSGSRQVPTSCESTSFCKGGYCFDSSEGTCLDNTPQNVCNAEEGIWSENFPLQCSLGCCILGDQAAFVTLTRCGKLSSFLGLMTNFDKGIADEVSCVLSVQNQDKGACVYDLGEIRDCKFTTRAECGGTSISGINGTAQGEFYKDKLCSAPELGTKCFPSPDVTACVDGKDEVYFFDTCGNPANIYDASKANDKEYWTNVKSKEESCSSGSANANSRACGNCDYLQGSICRAASRTNKPNYGNYICEDLNCKSTSNGESYLHGESWCVYDDEGQDKIIGKDADGDGVASVGSRYYRHVCVNCEEVVESCADFRNEVCIEDTIEQAGEFQQAACRVNRWQDCLSQTEVADCENSDRRDCLWIQGIHLGNVNGPQDGTVIPQEQNGTCIPQFPPGLKFWDQSSETVCAQVNTECVVKWERKKGFAITKGFTSGDWECVENCKCLDDKWWTDSYGKMCLAVGDCGPNVNWLGEKGYKLGFRIVNQTSQAVQSAPQGTTPTSGSPGSTSGSSTVAQGAAALQGAQTIQQTASAFKSNSDSDSETDG